MNEAQYRKALLLTKIDAHRSIFRLEVRCARASLDLWTSVLSLLGFDSAVVDPVATALRSVLGSHHGGAAVVPLLVAALMPLVSGHGSADKPADAGETSNAAQAQPPG